MQSYLDLVKHVLDNGVLRKNRTGTDTLMVFGYHYKVNLDKGFPKTYMSSIDHQVLIKRDNLDIMKRNDY